MSRQRVDKLLIALYPQLTRGKIQSLVEKRKILVRVHDDNWQVVDKSGDKFETTMTAEDFRVMDDDELHFVSRGALKLKKAIEEFGIAVEGKVCLDVGLSTGGFTDYLLQNGARQVMGIDVGQEQLHPKLRQEERLRAYDKINAKHPIPSEILQSFFGDRPAAFDLIVVDVSFISLTKIIPNIVNYRGPGGVMVLLVKPQFELDRGALNKKGVVKDRELISGVIEKIIGVLEQNKLKIRGYVPSPIEGENGNQEILMAAE